MEEAIYLICPPVCNENLRRLKWNLKFTRGFKITGENILGTKLVNFQLSAFREKDFVINLKPFIYDKMHIDMYSYFISFQYT